MDGMELMSSAMRAATVRLDASAGNLANLSSDGFHRSVAHVSLRGRGLVAAVVSDTSAGPLRHTGRSFDLAVAGEGAFFVRDARSNDVAVRSASLVRDGNGTLRDTAGRALLGNSGVLRVAQDATIDQDGTVRGPDGGQGHVRVLAGSSLQAGFLEAANVNAVREMVDVLSAQRAFETAEQTLAALDDARSKAVNDVARVKS